MIENNEQRKKKNNKQLYFIQNIHIYRKYHTDDILQQFLTTVSCNG